MYKLEILLRTHNAPLVVYYPDKDEADTAYASLWASNGSLKNCGIVGRTYDNRPMNFFIDMRDVVFVRLIGEKETES